MVIYEVNLTIDQAIFENFLAWLNEHIKKMLTFPGFIEAKLYEVLPDQAAIQTPQQLITVAYRLDSLNDLQHYLANHATKMRQEGLERFGQHFSATRRILNEI